MMVLRQHAQIIYSEAIQQALPDTAVEQALQRACLGPGRILLVSVGKAAWQMAAAAIRTLERRNIHSEGIVITKYGHSRGDLPGMEILEAGHPVVDAASFAAAGKALERVEGLQPEDTVVFLLSGGGSALFEQSELPLEELQDITDQLLACGADIREMNCIRKRLSNVKGGRFAERCAPAKVLSIILSDVVGDQLDMIASGPTVVDTSTLDEALEIEARYHLRLSPLAKKLMERPLPTELPHVYNDICGSVAQLCQSAVRTCERLGYQTMLLSDHIDTQARLAGRELAERLVAARESGAPVALVMGGETVVKLTGHGKGGRNQELALSAAPLLAGLPDTAIFSVGSDGTDGPTDAAGGFVDGSTMGRLADMGIEIPAVLQENDAYHALEKVDGLIFTGPTGTNVNDLSVGLFYPLR